MTKQNQGPTRYTSRCTEPLLTPYKGGGVGLGLILGHFLFWMGPTLVSYLVGFCEPDFCTQGKTHRTDIFCFVPYTQARLQTTKNVVHRQGKWSGTSVHEKKLIELTYFVPYIQAQLQTTKNDVYQHGRMEGDMAAPSPFKFFD